jgi:hypothetical protein
MPVAVAVMRAAEVRTDEPLAKFLQLQTEVESVKKLIGEYGGRVDPRAG